MATENTGANENRKTGEENRQPRPAEGKGPVKKKKIIIVTGNSGANRQGQKTAAYSSSGGGSYSGGGQGRSYQGQGGGARRNNRQGQGQQGSQGGRRDGRGGAARGGIETSRTQHRIIRPTVKPTQMEVDFHKPVQPVRTAPKKPEAEQIAAESAAAVTAPSAAAPAAQVPETAAHAEKPVAAPAVPANAAPVQEAPAVQKAPAPAETPVKEAAAPAQETARADNAEKTAPAAQAAPQARPAEQAQQADRRPARQQQAGERRVSDRPADGRGRDRAAGAAAGTRGADRFGDRTGAGRTQGRPAGRFGEQGGARPYRQNDQGARTGAGRTPGQGAARQGGFAGRDRDGRSARPGQGFRGAQGGFRPGQGTGAGQGRPGQFGGADRGGSRRGAGGRPGAEAFGGDKHRDDKNRKGTQDRDRRSRKDAIYTEDESRRKNRAGRFIRPEKKEVVPAEEQIKTITIPDKLTIRELAEAMHMNASDIIKKLFLAGQVMTPNSEVEYDEAEKIALDYDILCEKEEKVDVIEELLKEEDDAEESLETRPPVICVMGHVDHGKTSLLDAIRKTNVTDKEAGGITQAIGAYTITLDGRTITFLDTPGHEAFTAMRMRGANSTDIAVLVIAADDGVMPQTVEAINHAKAAGVEIIVAVNKIDKPGANIDRVKQEMTEYELIPTDWGGSTEFVPVSAKTGEGIEDLLETILLTADILDLKANPNRKARGLVLEAKLDKGRGPVANVLVQKGTLRIGDFISAGASAGKVRAMIDDKGRRVKEAKPSQPVEILGLSDVPSAGEVLVAHETNDDAKAYAETYKTQHKEELIEETRMRMNLDDLFNQMKEGNLKEFNLIIKADVQGSVEALKQSLLKLSNEEVVVKVIHAAVGAITESDVTLASASNAVIIGFGVRPEAMAKSMAEHEGVDIRLYKVIYQAIDAVEAALKGMLAPVYEERVIGHAEVRQLFKASRVGNIAGSMVIDGIIRRGCSCRIRRGDEQIYEGNLASLKRFKDDVKEVISGQDCGLNIENYNDIKVGDIVEAYEVIEIKRKL